ncbi:MAG: fatty acid desaturase family protein [Acidobacteriota bacterium]|nr:fatty acid desaturase family protein [Acidobacteriota bacterium]
MVQEAGAVRDERAARAESADGERREHLSPQLVRELSRLNPPLAFGHILVEWSAILGAAWLCDRFFHPLLYVLVVPFIGARLHALGFLLHDAAHVRLLPSKRWNDLLADLLLAFPLFITLRDYRKTHLTHHRHLNTDRDPDWVAKQTPAWSFPKTFGGMVKFLLKPWSTAKSELHWAGGGKRRHPPALTAARLLFYALVAVLLTVLGLWRPFAMYWLVPMFLWWPIAMRITSMAEHFGLAYESIYSQSRTIIPNLFDRIFISPKNAGYHLDHHLYPSVPFYRLPRLHQALLELPEYRQKAHITHGYWGVLRECMRGPRDVVPGSAKA